MERAKPKGRRLAFSLKTLMLLVLPIAVWLGWVANKARQQRDAVAAIKQYGGFAYYDYEFINGHVIRGREPCWAPKWLRRLVGDEYFREAIGYNSAPSWRKPSRSHARVMPYLRGLTGLRFLSIGLGQTSDAGLSNIRGLTKLEKLYLSDAGELTDAGLANLTGLWRLRILHIDGAKITDTGIAHLKGLTGTGVPLR